MNKIIMEYDVPKNVKFLYRGKEVEVIPFLSLDAQAFLINSYLEDYSLETENVLISGTKFHSFEADCKMVNYILKLNTNIDVDSCENSIYADMGLWNLVTRSIENWSQFEKRLNSVLYDIEKENSLGTILDNLLNRVDKMLAEFEKVTPEDIERMATTGKDLISELGKSAFMKNPNDFSAVAQPLIEEINKE